MSYRNKKTFDLPEYWACYLVYGEDSSLTDAEMEEIDKFQQDNGVSSALIEISDKPAFFGIFRGKGCNLITIEFWY